jgi:hypothetical protein
MFHYSVNYKKNGKWCSFVLRSLKPLLKKDIKAACKRCGLTYLDSDEMNVKQPLRDYYVIVDGIIAWRTDTGVS